MAKKRLTKRQQQERFIKNVWDAIAVTELSSKKTDRERLAQLAFTILALMSGNSKGISYSLKASDGNNVELMKDLYMLFYDLDPRKKYEGLFK